MNRVCFEFQNKYVIIQNRIYSFQNKVKKICNYSKFQTSLEK
jgi:hypothetical protein